MADNDQKRPGIRLHRGKRGADSALIAALILGATMESACTHAGVSMSTLTRRLRSPGFQRKLAEARREIVRRAVDKAAYYGVVSLDRLYHLSQSGNEAIALGAARSLAEISFRMREIGSFEERLAALESERGGDDGEMRLLG
jgi:glycine/serine hydroxymethyltransferase